MIWRVIIWWSYVGLNFTSERGVKASNAGIALNNVMDSLRVDRADSFKAQIELASSLDAFSDDARALPLVNGRGALVREAFE